MEEETGTSTERRRLPAWLLGFLIAAAVFVIALVVFRALGFGDNPVLDGSLGLLLL